MVSTRAALRRNARLLLDVLVSPARGIALPLDDWDLVVRSARGARLLGVLRARFEREGLLGSVPPEVRVHLDSAWATAVHRRQMVLQEMRAVAKVLGPLGVPMVLLKGGAYIAQGLRCAEGRILEDLDLMVPRDRLDESERALLETGWAFEKTDAYDQHYYRAWSHALPPMRLDGHLIELDVHHTISPPTGRVRPDAGGLFERSVAIPGSPFRALSPADQVRHASAHLFQASDCTERLRDLVDIDALVREHSVAAGFWAALLARAGEGGYGRCLWYALRYGGAWLDTPVPREVSSERERYAPPAIARAAMDRLLSEGLPPRSPEREPAFSLRLAWFLLLARSTWLRMPPWLLAYHSLAKALRGVRKPRAVEAE
jgi:hypothetical protein